MTDIDGSRVVEGNVRDILKLTQVFLQYVSFTQQQTTAEDRTAETSVSAAEPEPEPQFQQPDIPPEDPERAALVSEMAQRAASLRTAVTAVADLLDRLEDERRSERRRRSGRRAASASGGANAQQHVDPTEHLTELLMAEARSRAAAAASSAFVRIPTMPESAAAPPHIAAGGFGGETHPSQSRRPGAGVAAAQAQAASHHHRHHGPRRQPPVPRLNLDAAHAARPGTAAASQHQQRPSTAPAIHQHTHQPPPPPPRVGSQRPLTALSRSINRLNSADVTCARYNLRFAFQPPSHSVLPCTEFSVACALTSLPLRPAQLRIRALRGAAPRGPKGGARRRRAQSVRQGAAPSAVGRPRHQRGARPPPGAGGLQVLTLSHSLLRAAAGGEIL